MGPYNHPILDRLTQALQAAFPAPLRSFGLGPIAQYDETALRDWVLRHYGQYAIDPVWVLTGHGQPPDVGALADITETPVFALAPIDPGNGHWAPRPIETIRLAPELLGSSRFVVKMDNRAMEPRIRQGAYLVVDADDVAIPRNPLETAPSPESAKVFAVAVTGEGLLVRLVVHDPNRNRLVLTSLDPDYPPLFIPQPNADSRVVGRVVWLAQNL